MVHSRRKSKAGGACGMRPHAREPVGRFRTGLAPRNRCALFLNRPAGAAIRRLQADNPVPNPEASWMWITRSGIVMIAM